MNMKVYAGIEGGASFSKVVLLNHDGEVLSFLDSEPSSNIWLMEKKEWAERINKMVCKALQQASLSQEVMIESLGLCLSGCENEDKNVELSKLLKDKYPNLSKNCFLASDTIGSIMTCSPDGGIILIAGTGSNSNLVYPDGTAVRCGGWGHMIGDYGSAFWIALRLIRFLIEAEENYNPITYDTSKARKMVFDHFNVTNNMGLLKPLYTEFDKAFVAQLCAKIAKLAIEDKDPLSLQVFEDAGEVLAQHVLALLPKIEGDEVPIICVGSVFKSWTLMEEAFFAKIGACPKRIRIRYLTQTSAIGAAFFAARKVGVRLPIDFSGNYRELCCYKNGTRIN